MYHSYKQIKKKTKMIVQARQMIAAASAGSIEIEAVAWPLRAIDTSLDGKRVVFRHIEVQKLVKRGKSSSWDTMWEKMTTEPYLVFDHTGFMIVDSNRISTTMRSLTDGLTRFECNPEKLSADQLNSFDEFYDGNVSGFKAKLKGTTSFLGQLFSFRAFRIVERAIPVGSPLLVIGNFTPEDKFRYIDISPDFQLFKDRACKLLTNKSYQISLLDKNKDGEVDLEELKSGFQTARAHSFNADLALTNIKSVGASNEKLYGTITGTSENELIITEGLETQILKNSPVYRNWLGLYLGAAIVACSIILFIILA
jgi:hypothetical protein